MLEMHSKEMWTEKQNDANTIKIKFKVIGIKIVSHIYYTASLLIEKLKPQTFHIFKKEKSHFDR